METQTGRPLSEAEMAVLRHILSVPFPGAGELRQQIAGARVISNWAGSPSVDIFVPLDIPPAHVPDGLAPVTAEVTGESGDYLGELLLWTTAGRIAALEYSWVTDEPPDRLPEPSRIKVTPGT